MKRGNDVEVDNNDNIMLLIIMRRGIITNDSSNNNRIYHNISDNDTYKGKENYNNA